MAEQIGTCEVSTLTGFTVTVKLSTPLKLRIKIGLALVRLGVWVIGGSTEIEQV